MCAPLADVLAVRDFLPEHLDIAAGFGFVVSPRAKRVVPLLRRQAGEQVADPPHVVGRRAGDKVRLPPRAVIVEQDTIGGDAVDERLAGKSFQIVAGAAEEGPRGFSERAPEILTAWRAWIETVPVACESLGRMLQLPDAPFLPEAIRGRSFVLVEVALLGSGSDGAALVQPLRDLGPEMDTLALMPPSELSVVNMDPDFPLPYAGEGILLTDLPVDSIDGLVEAFIGSPLLHLEARQLGGAAAKRSPEHGVLDAIDEPFVLFTFGLTPDAEARAAVDRQVEHLLGTIAPWDSGRRYLNFAESKMDPRSIFPAESYDRLLAARRRYDPTGLFVANHSVE